jgi:hypothetical protein
LFGSLWSAASNLSAAVFQSCALYALPPSFQAFWALNAPQEYLPQPAAATLSPSSSATAAADILRILVMLSSMNGVLKWIEAFVSFPSDLP